MESQRVSAYFCKFQKTHCPPAVPTNLLPTPILSKQRTGKAKILQNTEYRQAPLCQSQIPYYCRDFMFICSTSGHITPSLLHIMQYSGDQLLNLPSFFQVSAPHCPGRMNNMVACIQLYKETNSSLPPGQGPALIRASVSLLLPYQKIS